MRAPTLAEHARHLYGYSDEICLALRGGDLEEVQRVIDEVRSFAPPHGIDPIAALIVVAHAQIDVTVPVEERLGWVESFDPARFDGAA